MVRGRKVGDAYIEVHGDNQDWITAVRRQRKAWGAEGQEAGKAFGDRMMSTIQGRVDRDWKRLTDSFALEDFSAFEKQAGSVEEGYQRALRVLKDMHSEQRATNALTAEQADQVRNALGAWRDRRVAAERELEIQRELNLERETAHREAIAEERERQALEKKGLERLKQMERDRIDLLVQRSISQGHFLRIEGDQFELANQRMIKALTERGRKFDATLSLERETFREHGERILNIIQDHANKVNREFDSLYDRYAGKLAKDLGINVDDLTEKQRTAIRRMVRDHQEGHQSIEKSFGEMSRSIEERFLTATRTVERDSRRMARTVGDDTDFYLVGRLRGARNNFLNILGRLFQPVERLIGRGVGNLFGGAADAMAGSLDRLASSAANAESPLARLVSGPLARLATVLPRLGRLGPAALIALGVAINVFVIAGSALASLLSGLAAMLTGVFSAAILAAQGLLVGLLPIVGALGLGIAAVAIGFSDMTDAQKESLEPLKDWFEETRTAIQERLFEKAGEQASAMAGVLEEFLTPALEASAGAVSDFISDMIELSQSPDFQRVMGTLRDTLPDIFRNILRIGGSVFAGLGAVMAAIAPQVKEITDGIAETVEDWAEWAASAEGQNTIKEWFEDARAAAKTFWELITGVGDVIGSIVKLTAPTGLKWIDGWVDGLERFDKWLNSDQGQQAVEDWMQRAEDLAGELGELIDAAGRLFDTLDSEQGSNFLTGIIDAATIALNVITWLSESVLNFWAFVTSPSWGEAWSHFIPWGELFGIDGGTFQVLATEVVDKIIEALSGAWDAVVEWMTKAAVWIVEGFQDGWDTKWAEIKEWLLGKLEEFLIWFAGFFGIASPSTVFFQFGVDIVQGLINGLLSMITGLTDAATQLAESILNVVIERFPEIVATGIELLLPLIPGITSLVPGANNAARLVGKAIGDGIAGEASKAPGRAASALSPLPGVVRSKATEAAAAGGAGMSRLPSIMQYYAQAAVGAVASALSGLYSIGYSAGNAVGSGFVAGMDAMIPSVYAKAAGMAFSARKAAEVSLLTGSPSRVFIGLGMDVAEGFGIGMESQTQRVISAASSMAEAVISAVNPDSMYDQGRRAADGLARGLSASTPNLNATIDAPAIPGTGGAGSRTAIFGPGSVVVDSRAKNAKIVAEQVVDDLSLALEG